MNSKFLVALHSRTVWTIVLMVAYNVMSAFGQTLSPDLNVLVNAVLGALAAYFRVNPATPPAQP